MKRTKRGFTLVELVITVAILAVLLTLAVPALSGVRRNMELTRLDHNAREIFLAAQNNLTQRHSAGTLEAVRLGAEDDTDCYWVTDTKPDDLAKVLPDSFIDEELRSHHLAICYNAKSGTVLESFYSEKQTLDERETQIAYANDAERRARDGVGYYNSSADDGVPPTGDEFDRLPDPKVEIKDFIGPEKGNDKCELRAMITVPDGCKSILPQPRLVVTAYELDDQGNKTGQEKELLDQPAMMKCEPIVLDNLYVEKERFSKQFPKFTPGADILVEAVLQPAGDDETHLPSSGSDIANSLFASRKPVGVGKDAYVEVEIVNARHLQNLTHSYSGITGTLKAEQINEIIWDPTRSFISINSSSEKAGYRLAAYHGNEKEIRMLNSVHGLFSYAKNMELSGIRLVAPVIGAAGGNVGALAGLASGTTEIRDCQVFVESDGGEIKSDQINSGVTGNGVADRTTGQPNCVGGLVGSAVDKVRIENCFASLPSITGGTVGGLVGNAGGQVTLEGCYAAAGWHDSGDETKWLGGLLGKGTDPAVGGLVGRTTGKVTIANCYAVGYSGNETAEGLYAGMAKIRNSYWALNLDEGTLLCAYQNGTKIQEMSLPELKTAKLGAAFHYNKKVATYPYSKICKGVYPYPALLNGVGDVMPHYGDWPTKEDFDLKLYDPEGHELEYLMVPGSGGLETAHNTEVTGVVKAFKGTKVVNLKGRSATVSNQQDKAGIFAADPTLTYSEANGRMELKLKGGAATGATYVDLEVAGSKLRVPVIVYTAEIELEGYHGNKQAADKSSSIAANQDRMDQEKTFKVMHLDLTKEARFAARLEVHPSAKDIQDVFNPLFRDTTVKTSLKTENVIDPAKWLGVQVVIPKSASQAEQILPGGPGVSANPMIKEKDPQISEDQNVYVLQDIKDGKQFPVVPTQGEVKANQTVYQTKKGMPVRGTSAGSAQVSVTWTMDRELTAYIPIRVNGVQAAIANITVDGDLGLSRNFDRYPYLAIVQPRPNEVLTLKPTAKLFSVPPAGTTDETYTWKVTKQNQVVWGPEAKKPGEDGTVSIELTDQKDRVAMYKLELTYSYTDPNTDETYSSKDFMYIMARRRTSINDQTTDTPSVKVPGRVRLEQIHSKDYPDVDKATIVGELTGAEDDQLVWYLKQSSGADYKPGAAPDVKLNNGQMEPVRCTVPMYGKEQTLTVAELNWVPGDEHNPSGSVNIRALDFDYYGDDPIRFQLYAVARDNNENDNPAVGYVTVEIMPKLKIMPQSKTVVRYLVSQKWNQVEFSSNREEDPNYEFVWKVDAEGSEVKTGALNDRTLTLKNGWKPSSDSMRIPITLTYGPHRASSVLNIKNFFKGFYTGFNHDGENSGEPYFLVKRGEVRELEMSWATSTSIYEIRVDEHPEPPKDGEFDFIRIDHNSDDFQLSNSHQYSVAGRKYGGPIPMTWGLKSTIEIMDKAADIDVYVIGGGFAAKQLGEVPTEENSTRRVVIQTDLKNPVQGVLEYNYFVPDGVFSDKGTVTFTDTSRKNMGAVEIVENTAKQELKASKDVQTCTMNYVPKIYGKSIITATYKVGKYEMSEDIELWVEPTAEQKRTPVLTYCTKDDLAGIKTAIPSGSGLQVPTLPAVYADYNGKTVATLMTSEPFKSLGYDTVWLKAELQDENGEPVELSRYQFICSVNNRSVTSYEKIRAADGKAWYIQVKARNGSLAGEIVEVKAEIGAFESQTCEVKVYSNPSVVIGDFSEPPNLMTNGHILVQGFNEMSDEEKKSFDLKLQAKLEPALMKPGENGQWEAVDGIVWVLEYPAAGYLGVSLIDPVTGKVTDEIHGSAAGAHIQYDPQCKVALKAQSALAYQNPSTRGDVSVAGYALTFTPSVSGN